MVWLRVPYCLLEQRYTSRQNQNAQAHGQQDFPSHLHELVKAIARERATIPDIHVHEAGNFGGKPENILNSNTDDRNKENQTDQAKDYAEASQSDGLNPEERMLRHAGRVVEADGSEKKKRDAGEKREHLIPGCIAQ